MRKFDKETISENSYKILLRTESNLKPSMKLGLSVPSMKLGLSVTQLITNKTRVQPENGTNDCTTLIFSS